MNKAFQYPVFENDAIHELFLLDTSPDSVRRIREIMESGEAIVPDLEKIINAALEYYTNLESSEELDDEFQDSLMHAFLLLAELRAAQSFPIILRFALSGYKTVNYWLGDTDFAIMPRAFLHCGVDSLPEMQALLMRNDASDHDHDHDHDHDVVDVVQIYVSKALVWMGIPYPEKRDAIIQFFRSYLRSETHPVLTRPEKIENGFNIWLLERNEDRPTVICSTLATAGYHELREDIEQFWAAGKAFEDYTSIEHIREDFDNPEVHAGIAFETLLIQPIEKTYEWIEQTFRRPKPIPPRKPLEELTPKSYSSTTLVRSEPKIGRNDPCPMGFEKKFKKCCGTDGHTVCVRH
jgi:hypothetical protein